MLAIPAFTGYPLATFTAWIVPGLSWSRMVYFLVVNLLLWLLTGPRRYATMLTVAALIAMPVVFGGGTISWLLYQLAGGAPPSAYSAHYVNLCLTMLTVIPLALALVMTVPWRNIENRLLTSTKGVYRLEKVALMSLRVFNHIVFGVIPQLMEILREERLLSNGKPSGPGDRQFRNINRQQGGRLNWRTRLTFLFGALAQVGLAGICNAIQFLPIWALEIAQLPERKKDDLSENP